MLYGVGVLLYVITNEPLLQYVVYVLRTVLRYYIQVRTFDTGRVVRPKIIEPQETVRIRRVCCLLSNSC